MTKTIKELAKELNCSYEAVRKQTKRYAKELQDHIYTQHKTQFLDDYACEFIKSKRMDTPSVISRIEYDEAVEILKEKYTALLEEHNDLLKERDALKGQVEDIKRLEASNASLSEEIDKQKMKIVEAEKTAQKAQNELVRAHEKFELELKRREENYNQELEAEKNRKLTFAERLFGRKREN